MLLVSGVHKDHRGSLVTVRKDGGIFHGATLPEPHSGVWNAGLASPWALV